MLDVLLSPLLGLSQKHIESWSNNDSPRSSTDDCSLPFSPADTCSDTPLTRRIQLHIPIFLVIISLPISTALVLWCLYTLPISLSWPHNITDLAQLGRDLHGYSHSGPGPLLHVISVMAISAIWKHAWSIPGSVLWVRFIFVKNRTLFDLGGFTC